MQVEHVQQHLVRIHSRAVPADETHLRQLRIPLLLELDQQRTQALQVAGEPLIEERGHVRVPVAVEPVHGVE
ncbi:hypothetical protein, partial [Piscinibacter sp.]|uniref:hypothetical protein n=1 Tax=Piscinibacter sp. TaxID=1903157 RepID=UPI002CAB41E8